MENQNQNPEENLDNNEETMEGQGTDIHIGPGQEKHLPHEAWHVVQQKKGRVKPSEMSSDEESAGE